MRLFYEDIDSITTYLLRRFMLSEKDRKRVRALYAFTVVMSLYIIGIAAVQTYLVYFLTKI